MFEIITVGELIKRLEKYNHKEFHPHHVASPDHKTYNAKPDPLYWQATMKEFHVKTRGFADIAQHCTLLPDGRFVTGRDFGRQPASMTGQNGKNGDVFMIEMIGNFNVDKLAGLQKESVMKLAKWFLDRGKIIKFHRDYASTDCPGKSIDKAKFIAEARAFKEGEDEMLQVGNKGAETKVWQEKLIKLGYDLGRWGADGDFGGATQKAVEDFQRANSLPINGMLDIRTMVAIEVKGLDVEGLKQEITALKNKIEKIRILSKQMMEV